MKIQILAAICMIWGTSIQAQAIEDTTEQYQNFWKYGKEVGLNVSPLLRKFIPFNLSPTNPVENLLALKTKWYGEKRAHLQYGEMHSEHTRPTNQPRLVLFRIHWHLD